MKKKPDCLIILGMHRSGTSSLAACLNLLGVDFGINTAPSLERSKNLSYLNNELVLIHDILLRDLGCKWDMIGNLPEAWQVSEAADRAREKIRSYIERNFASNRIWGVNDPRICRFMPLWHPLLEEMGIKPGLIVNLRHPLETCRSLAESNGFNLRKSFFLWLAYYRDALSACREKSNVVIAYDQFLADPLSTLKFIGESLDIDFAESLQKFNSKLSDFVSSEISPLNIDQPLSAEESELKHILHLYDQVSRFGMETSEGYASEAGQVDGIVRYNKEFLPALEQVLSSGGSASDIRKSRWEIAISFLNQMVNDLLALVGDYERNQRSLDLETERKLINITTHEETLFVQVYFPRQHAPSFTEEFSKKILLPPAEWQEIKIPVPDSMLIRKEGFRLKPLNTRGIVNISSIRLINVATGEAVFRIETLHEFEKCLIRGDGVTMPGQAGLTLFVFSDDPIIILSPIFELPDCPLEIRVWIKVQTNQEEIKNLLIMKQEQLHQLETNLLRLRDQLASAIEEVQKERESRGSLETVKQELEKELSKVRDQWSSARAETRKEREARETIESVKQPLEKELSRVRGQLMSARTEARKEKEARESLELLKQELERNLSTVREQLSTAHSEIRKESKARGSLELLKREFENELSKLRDQLASARTETIKAQQQNSRLIDENAILYNNSSGQNEKIAQLERWMDLLRKDFNAILVSKRWKTGNAFIRAIELVLLRGKHPGAPDHIQQIFASHKSMREKESPKSKIQHTDVIEQSFSFDRFMRQLEKDITALSESARWKLGNALIRFVEVLLMRGKSRLALNHMTAVFKEFHKNTYQGQIIPPELMQKWMRQLEEDYQNILNSKRWRLGNSLVRIAEMLLMRKKQPLVTDHIRQLFDQFSQDRCRPYMNDSYALPGNSCYSRLNMPVSPKQVADESYAFDRYFPWDADSEQKKIEQELRTENERLLVQLHKVQEELESYFLKCRELESGINSKGI